MFLLFVFELWRLRWYMFSLSSNRNFVETELRSPLQIHEKAETWTAEPATNCLIKRIIHRIYDVWCHQLLVFTKNPKVLKRTVKWNGFTSTTPPEVESFRTRRKALVRSPFCFTAQTMKISIYHIYLIPH